MSAAIHLRTAEAPDRNAIIFLLAAASLAQDDILAPGTRYFVAEADGEVVGCIGIELAPPAALLRSLAVAKHHRRRGVGQRLVEAVLAFARRAGIERLYLFSTEAGAYFMRAGWREVPVAELSEALPDALQVRDFARRGWLGGETAWRRDI